MILSFSVANFRSFAHEQTLSMLASRRIESHLPGHTLDLPGSSEKVLCSAVIYGANGAGKSNLFAALDYLQKLALLPRQRHAKLGLPVFRFADLGDSEFDLQFVVQGQIFRYGCRLNEHAVQEEWLLRQDKNKEIVLYERLLDEDGKSRVKLGRAIQSPALRALAKVVGPANQSFLATICANLEAEDNDPQVQAVADWFQHGLVLIGPDAVFHRLADKLLKENDFLKFAGNFLQAAATGVDGVHVDKKEISEEELKAILPEAFLNKALSELDAEGSARIGIMQAGAQEIWLERTQTNHYYRISLQTEHLQDERGKVLLNLEEESDGTRRLLNLLPALHDLQKNDKVYVIDEIDRSLHPMLVREFMDCFLRSANKQGRQIIVTTHESSLLDLDLLRRDEIWFVEKDQKGASNLYSLTDFKVRTDLEIRKHYLQGRFGAIPFLGGLEALMRDQA